MEEERLKNLYKKVSDEGLDIGSYDDFITGIASPDRRKKLYGKLQDEGLDIGPYEQFSQVAEAYHGGPKKKSPNSLLQFLKWVRKTLAKMVGCYPKPAN